MKKNKRIIKNTEIADAVLAALEEKGYEMDYSKILDDIDVSRDPEEEEIPAEESIIESYINDFLEEEENKSPRKRWEIRLGWDTCEGNICDFEQEDVIAADCKCSRKQAQNYIKDGTCVYTPQGFAESLAGFFEMNFFNAEDQEEFLEENFGCKTLEELKAIAERGELIGGDISNSFLFYNSYPYVIQYCY